MRRYIWLMRAFHAMGAGPWDLAKETFWLIVSRSHREEWFNDTSWHT